MAIDAVGLLRRVELRLVFHEDVAAGGEPVVIHQNVEIVPDRLGVFRLRIHQIHDAQIGREPGGKALEALRRDAATGGIRPHRGDAIVEIRRRLADGACGHQGVAGGAVLAAPWQRRAARGGCGRRRRRGAGRRRGLSAFRERAGEDAVEKAQRPATGGRLCLRLAGHQQRRDHQDHARLPIRQLFPPPRHVLPTPVFRSPCRGFHHLNKHENLLSELQPSGPVGSPTARNQHPPLFPAAKTATNVPQAPARSLSRHSVIP